VEGCRHEWQLGAKILFYFEGGETKESLSNAVEQKWKREKCKVLIRVLTWVNLKNAILSEGNQSEKNTYYLIPFVQYV
jgi:hypothetical protein